MVLNYAYCNIAVMPLHKEAAHRSEQTSQLLYGEKVEIIFAEENGWGYVRCKADAYEGWCRLSQLTIISKKDFYKDARYLVMNIGEKLLAHHAHLLLPVGAELMRTSCEIDNVVFKYKGKKQKLSEVSCDKSHLKKLAMQFLYAPYQWGGRSQMGIDCSGFTQLVYKLCGKALSRDASQQASEGNVVDFLINAQIGDLAFFDNDEGRINHVGLLLDHETIIHATDTAGCVVVDKIDQGGIISSKLRKRTHNLRLVKRYF